MQIMQEPSIAKICTNDPKDIRSILKKKSQKTRGLIFKLFLGIDNINSDGIDGNYYPVISFSLLLVH